jgi:hypothetical protein
MSKTGKAILGIVTLWPLAYMPIFVGFWFYQAVLVFSDHQEEGGPAPGMIVIFVLHGLTILVSLALLFIYLVDVSNNDRIPEDKKLPWSLLILLGGIVACPIYWNLYIWPDRTDQPSEQNPTGQRP